MDAQYDYIVVGAGTADCIMAARLSEDPGVEVLLVEAGGTDRLPIIAMPGAPPFVYQSKHIQWGHQSGPEPQLAGKVIDEKAGRVLGGSSSINAMIFNRGNPMDYDGWAADGLSDWNFASCLPYFRKYVRGRRRRLARRRRPGADHPGPGRTQALRGVPARRDRGGPRGHRRPQRPASGGPAHRSVVHRRWCAPELVAGLPASRGRASEPARAHPRERPARAVRERCRGRGRGGPSAGGDAADPLLA